MTEQDEQPDEEVASEAADPRAGERLGAARREKQISVVEIAKELHLDEPKVRALERNEFEALGAAVFAKGHLRKYAELVDVDLDDVMTDYYQLTRGESAPPIIVGRNKPRRELSPGPWIAAGIVIVVLAAAYWWFGIRTPVTGPFTPPPAQPLPEESAPDATGAAPGPAAGLPAGQEAGAEAAEQASEPADGSAAPAASLPAPDEDSAAVDAAAAPVADPVVAEPEPLRLAITFSGDCWTEISDADGRRLYFGMGRDGQSVDLAGTAPISVLFGNGSNVSLFVDGEEYALPPVNPSNQTVRLSLDKTS